MKRKLPQSDSAVDYAVGLVSGSLSKSSPGPGSGSLSALFSTTASPSSSLFRPAPEIVRSVKAKERPKEEIQKKNDTPESQTIIQTRELGLSAGDEDELGGGKRRKTRPQADDPAELWVQRRHQRRQNKLKEKERENRTVFVGNLPLSATKKTLKLLFQDTGAIESIRFRSLVREDPSMSRRAAAIMRKAHPQKQTINAYVVFRDEDSATSALDRNGVELQPELFIRVDRVNATASHDHKRSVFVGNLPFDLKEAALRSHFQDCGSVEAVRLIRDKGTGLGKGFGYLLFKSADSVQLALRLDASQLDGRAIRVKRSQQREGPERGSRPGARPGAKPGSRPWARPGAKPGSRPGAKPGSKPGSRPGAKPGSKPGSRPGARPTGPGAFRGEMADPRNKKDTKKYIKKKKTKGKQAKKTK
ncbi:unnamed protein product [Knipowitschia caucasica]|uniref:RRM domain-containing protein n=1 Tax=Knipowitschia caucasica TaxID=637954 RepID=A0AAV2LHE9_KNICA